MAKVWYMHVVKYYTAIKKNELNQYALTWRSIYVIIFDKIKWEKWVSLLVFDKIIKWKQVIFVLINVWKIYSIRFQNNV